MSHVVIRTVRPYPTEEAFLQAEGWTLSRKGIVLLEQEPIAKGTVVRFELQLEGGKRLMRAEGVVSAFQPASATHPSQLELTFKRFDASTKALIESAEALAALTADDFEEIDDVEALSDVDASEPVHTEVRIHSSPENAADSSREPHPTAPLATAAFATAALATEPLQSSPSSANIHTAPLATELLHTPDSVLSPDSAPDTQANPEAHPERAAADDAVHATLSELRSSGSSPPPSADPGHSSRRSSWPPPRATSDLGVGEQRGSTPPPVALASDSGLHALNDSALKLDALISEALSEPPPAPATEVDFGPLPPMTPLPSSESGRTQPGGAAPEFTPVPEPETDPSLSAPRASASELERASDPEQPSPEPSQEPSAQLVSQPAAPALSESGVHPRPESQPGATPALRAPENRDELLMKLRDRALRKAAAREADNGELGSAKPRV